jgi:hypothetical protein
MIALKYQSADVSPWGLQFPRKALYEIKLARLFGVKKVELCFVAIAEDIFTRLLR